MNSDLDPTTSSDLDSTDKKSDSDAKSDSDLDFNVTSTSAMSNSKLNLMISASEPDYGSYYSLVSQRESDKNDTDYDSEYEPSGSDLETGGESKTSNEKAPRTNGSIRQAPKRYRASMLRCLKLNKVIN